MICRILLVCLCDLFIYLFIVFFSSFFYETLYTVHWRWKEVSGSDWSHFQWEEICLFSIFVCSICYVFSNSNHIVIAVCSIRIVNERLSKVKIGRSLTISRDLFPPMNAYIFYAKEEEINDFEIEIISRDLTSNEVFSTKRPFDAVVLSDSITKD